MADSLRTVSPVANVDNDMMDTQASIPNVSVKLQIFLFFFEYEYVSFVAPRLSLLFVCSRGISFTKYCERRVKKNFCNEKVAAWVKKEETEQKGKKI